MRTNFLFVLLTVAGSVFPYTAQVTSVVDGDTFTVRTEKQERVIIRLAGADAPERNQAFREEAKQALSDKISGATVEIKEIQKDRANRTIANVYLNDRWINLEQVTEGWAWNYDLYLKDEQMAAAEKNARTQRIGLWAAETSPIAPWEFRQKCNMRN